MFISVICYRCNGSGEGFYDGSICSLCRGEGELLELACDNCGISFKKVTRMSKFSICVDCYDKMFNCKHCGE